MLSFDISGPLEYLVRIEFSALGKMSSLTILKLLIKVDGWFVEDEKLLEPHPKDPYKRIDTIPSSREIRIEVDGTVVATSTQNVFLYETMLRTRYYLSSASINYEYLTESETTTYCPYKGMAKYVSSQISFALLTMQLSSHSSLDGLK
jgi:uncharacterized protein (DUF427 family)